MKTLLLLLAFQFTLANALTLLVVLASFGFVWYLAVKIQLFPPAPAPGTYAISLEYDIDKVPFTVGSTLTVFGVTFVIVNHVPVVPNQVQAAIDYTEQWENFYSALVAAEIEPGVPFTNYYSLAYGFYITITDTGNRGVAPNLSGFFDGAVNLYVP